MYRFFKSLSSDKNLSVQAYEISLHFLADL